MYTINHSFNDLSIVLYTLLHCLTPGRQDEELGGHPQPESSTSDAGVS